MREPTSRLTRVDVSSADGLEVSDDEPVVGRIGRFNVLHKLGEGGMGVVYAAHDQDLDRHVAIKLLRTTDGDLGPARARLLREARAMAKLSHPNVITIYDVGTVDDRIFIAMELVKGTTLRRWLAAKPRTWRGVVERFSEAGRGLAAAHGAGLIHRDFKPDNVLVGDDGRVRVVDFGLARRVDLEDTEPTPPSPDLAVETTDRLTLTGAVMGTPAYMAPEQWRGLTVDHRTDQFAFAVALWEALFGVRPFGSGTVHVIVTHVLAGEIASPPEDRPVPTWLRRVLERALSTEPDDRFWSMDELLFVLSRLNRDADDLALPPAETAIAITTPLFARRYELRSEPSGSMAVARDRLTGRLVAVRWLVHPTTSPVAPEPDRVATHLRALVGLRHPGLATVLDCGTGDTGPWVVTEHFESAVELVAWGREQPEAIRVNLVMQLLRVTEYLHAHDLLHRALSPHTVCVVDGQVKIRDPTPCLVRAVDARTAYAAPEVLLDERSDARADLYSVGVLAYELLTGKRPHRSTTPGDLVDEALAGSPVLDAGTLEPELRRVVERLLQPDPAARYASASEALRALVEAAGVPLQLETVETRESVLRTARFAGRDAELGRLVQALRRCAQGNGEVWLVGGDSGTGKSRLLDELSAEAMSRGLLVLRGQAKAEGGRPYEVWRAAFRMLALAADDDLVAWVLATVVPDIDELRGRAIKRAAPLDANNAQIRLTRAVMQALAAVGRPVLLLLEDLQWSRAESIDLLRRISTQLGGLPVLVVGSYRDDEAPALPEDVPEARSLALDRLAPQAVAELARAMTGSADAKLVALLERETEGNAFFLVEVVRYLAEEAGDLRRVGRMQLPSSVVSGGVRRVLRRRLERVEAWARPLLEAAAVAGRAVDPELLRRLADGVDVDRFLAHASACAVLEQEGEGWRFRHDKLREHVLSTLSDDRRKALHGDIAAALEEAHGDAETHTQALAHHSREAGDLVREARYAGRAGEQALRNGAHADAARLLARAIELRTQGGASRHDLLRWHRMLGEAYYVLGDLTRAVETLAATLRELGRPLPGSRIGWLWLLLRLVMVQAMLLARPGKFVARDRVEELREGAAAAGRIANLSTYSGDQLRIFAASLMSANLAERAGDANAYSLAVMGYSASYMGMPRLADRYFERALAAARAHDDPTAFVEASQMECAYRLGIGQFGRVRELLDDGYAAAERAGYQLGLALSEGFAGQCEFLLGNFEAMLADYVRARELLTMQSPEHEHSFICGEALALAMLGRFTEADRLLTDAVNRVGAHYLLGEAFVLATRAYVLAWAGDLPGALEVGRAAVAYVDDNRIAVPGPCGYVLGGPAEAFTLAAAAGLDALPAARRQLAVMTKWGGKHPVGEAPALLVEARLHALERADERAIDCCERALVSAKRLALRFVQAQAELELGRLRGADTEAGRGHLERARELYTRCGAAHHANVATALVRG